MQHISERTTMKIGDLVREKGLQERTGVIVGRNDWTTGGRIVYRVLWNKMSPTLPTLIGPAWRNQLEVIYESR